MANGSGAVRVRHDVWKLPADDKTLEWYARAVADMQSRPVGDPTSWRYQAAIHDYDPSTDPFAQPGDAMPSNADQQRFWRQCQHFSWFFLPWHRMYLHFFEQIVAATVVKLGGPPDWSLPYWNYSDANNPNARLLPPAFLADALVDGSRNALKVDARAPNENGDFGITDDEVSILCLRDGVFTGTAQGSHPGFGGPRTAFNHSSGAVGDLEKTPHGDIHVAVGGQNGFMSSFDTAGLDPIFWLHHANIDRLWEVWRGRGPSFINPTDNRWLAAQGATFQFHDASGAIVSMVPNQVVDSTAAPLSYRYEDVSDPLAGQAVAMVAAASTPMSDSDRPAELVGATTQPVTLPAGPTTAHVSMRAPTGPAAVAAAQGGGHGQVLLHLENITGTGKPVGYAVYLNVPDGSSDPRQHQELFAGTLPMFGVAESTRADSQHGGSGLTYVLDITNLVDHLRQQGRWDPNNLHVTFAPHRRAATDAGITVGRISVYYR